MAKITTVELVIARFCCGALCIALQFASVPKVALAQQQYWMDGKQVPKEYHDAGVLVHDGIGLLHSNRNQEAADKLAQAVKIAPTFAEAHNDYAIALAKTGKTQHALDEFKTALNLNPGLDSAWLSLGGLYQSSGNIAEALKAYNEFLTRFPTHPDAAKINSLVAGLQKEAEYGSASAPPPAPASGTTASAGAAGAPAPVFRDDYFNEATRGTVVRWAATSMPLRIYIHEGEGVAGYQPAFGKILRRSFDAWAAASNGLISFTEVNDPKNADIECSWESDGHKLQNAAESGETRLTTLKNSAKIIHCTIQLLTIPALPEMPMTENRIRQITLHEIGHALGLRGHTQDPHDAMFFSSTLEDQWKDLSPRDANTIIHLYSQVIQG